MSELRSIISAASKRSLVLVDEICRGTETAKGTCIAGSIVETLDKIDCLGIISTHLHGIFNLPLNAKNTVYKAMGTVFIDGQTKPTWKLMDGICRESLAFETAKREGIPETLIQRAEGLYHAVYAKEVIAGKHVTALEEMCSCLNSNGSTRSNLPLDISKSEPAQIIESTNQREGLLKKLESAINAICPRKLIEHYKEVTSEFAEIKCIAVGSREQPPPSTIGASSVYVMLRPDKKLYVGEVIFS